MNRACTGVGFLALAFFIGTAAGVAAQTTNHTANGRSQATATIALSALVAPSGDATAKRIAAATTRALTLILKLTGSYTVIDTGNLDPIMAFPRAVTYYQKVDARVGMFGTVTPNAGTSYTITVQYWRSEDPAAPPKTFTRRVSGVAGAVDAAYALALKVVGEVSNRALPSGTIIVKNTSHLKQYSIYADGELAARNADRIQLLAGQRTVAVAVPGPSGDRPVETFHIEVQAGKTITLSLKSAAAKGSKSAKPVVAAAPAAPAPPKGPTGSLDVSTSPPGAQVLLDGRAVGTTPLELADIPVGVHRIQLVHKYFLPAEETTTVVTGRHDVVDAVLAVNQVDPAVAARLISVNAVGVSSLLWSAVQASRFFALLNPQWLGPGMTFSLLTSTGATSVPGPSMSAVLDADFDLFPSRIGGRLAANSVVTKIDDAAAAISAAAATASVIVSKTSGSLQSQQLSATLLKYAMIGAAGTVLFDAVAAPVAARAANNEFLTYVVRHGSLPPAPEVPRYPPHRVIIASGGDSLVRLGYREPLVANYLALEESVGIGTATLSHFAPSLTGGVILSCNPWGASTGRLRPEFFAGVRASSDFTTTGVVPELGTGNDWVGKSFDIFARGGLGYDVMSGHWDQFFSIGTRIF